MKNTTFYHPLLCCVFLLFVGMAFGQNGAVKQVGAWGDQGNGTYKNPVLNADYSDPDVIRVGRDFYMVCSDFHFMGIPVLHSTDLVNWTIIGQVYNRLDIDPGYSNMTKYSRGSWAPALRYHNGKFYIYFCTPEEGLYMSTATDPAGKWSPLVEVQRVAKWEDPCPFWDGDGQAYLGHSRTGAGPIIIHKMSADGTRLLDTGTVVYRGPTAEGTKIYKRNGYYYIIIPEGGVGKGYETALRSKSIYGPYERRVVLEQGSTKTNGPHQGGWVELDSGESWFMHFQDDGAIGRVVHLEPMKWVDDWPVMGVDFDGNGIGEPVAIYNKPNVVKVYKITAPQTADEFDKPNLGLQWQWNHNPVDGEWSLSRPKGYLSLRAMQSPNNKLAKNTITQKLMGKKGMMTTKLDLQQMAPGQRAGLCLLGQNIYEIGVIDTNGKAMLFANNNGKISLGAMLSQQTIYLRLAADLEGNHTVMQYSLNGKDFIQLGEECVLSKKNYWKGVRPGLFSYNIKQDGGIALFDWFRYSYDGPAGGFND